MLAFKQSLLAPAVTSGQNANCFFQSFMHVFTQLPNEVHQQLLTDNQYKLPLEYFERNFNQFYATLLPGPFTIEEIIKFSRTLHPLEREIIFGPVLRATYNTLVEAKLIKTGPLGLGDNDIVLAHQTVAFTNCFGARLSVYMSEEELHKAQIGGMPSEVAERISMHKFEVDGVIFVCDSQVEQPNLWELNLVFAGAHLNYTLGLPELNQAERDKVIVKESNGAFYANGAVNPQTATIFHAPTPEIFSQRTEILFLMAKTNIAGISITTVNDIGDLSTTSLGMTDKGTTFITSDTVFGAASLSKPVFAYLVLKLIEANKSKDQLELGKFFLPNSLTEFDLDTPLYKILPLNGLSKEPYDLAKAKALTAKMVLSHVTGLPIMHDDKKGPLKFQFQPNTEYGYSGIGFAYLQKIIEYLTLSNLEALAKQYVFIPLEMHKSSFITDIKNPLETQAANSLHTTPSDYAKFVVAWMNDKSLVYAFKPIVPMTVDHWASKLKVPEDNLKHLAWGLGWGLQIDDHGNPVKAYHTGDMNNWRAWVAMDLERKTAIVYFANSPNGHVLADQIISPYIDLQHALNYFFPKYGFAREIEDDWQKLEEDRFKYIGEYLESRNEQPKLISTLSAELGFFRKVEKGYIIEHRHDGPELQHEYDKRFGLVLKK